MKLVQLVLLLSLAVGLRANTENADEGVVKIDDAKGISDVPVCQNIEVSGAYAEAAAKAKEQDIVGNLAKSRETVDPSLDTIWKQSADPNNEDDISSSAPEYGASFAIYLGLPLLCLVLTILIYPICGCCHLCANCCGYYGCECCCCPPKKGTDGSDNYYSPKEQTISFVKYFFLALATFICVLIGITGGNTFATGLLEMSCQFDGMRVTGKNLFFQLLKPADNLVSKIDGIVNETNVSMYVAHQKRGYKYTHERLTLYQEAIGNLTTKAKAVNASSFPYVAANAGLCTIFANPCPTITGFSNDDFDCQLCTKPGVDSLTALKDAIESTLREPSEKIKKETNGILTNLVGAQSMIKSGVGGIRTSLESVTSFMDDGGVWQTAASELIQGSIVAKDNATYAFGLPFGLVMFGMFLTVLGFFAMKTSQGSGKTLYTGNDNNMESRTPYKHPMSLGCVGKCGSCCVGCGWNLTCLTMLIFFLLCAVLWPFMYLSVDICVILEDKFPNKVGDYIPLGSGSAKMVQSCFTPGGNASFIPDDLVANFDFSGSVTFNSAKLKGDIDELFQNLPMNTVRSAVNKMTNFTQNQCDNEADTVAKKRICNIRELKELMTKIDTAETKYKNAMIISIDNIGQIQNITKPMFNFADGLLEDFSCLAVGEEFRATTGILCGSIVPGLSLFVMAMLLTALLGCPLACAGIGINKTMGGHGLPQNHDLYAQNGDVELTGFPMGPDSEGFKGKTNYI